MSGSPCCPPGSWGSPLADGQYQHKGRFEELGGMKCYVTGASPAKVVILSFSDVMPCLSDRKREVCDQLAEAIPNSQVVAPDFFKGKPIIEFTNPNASKFALILGLFMSTPRIMYRMKYLHNWSSLRPLLEGLTEELRERHSDAHLFCYGYCFGGYVACKVCSYLGFSAGVSYHPSPQVCTFQPPELKQTLQELASEVQCPMLMLPAGNDPDRLKEGGEFIKWLPAGSSSHTYPEMKHGYMSRASFDHSTVATMMGAGTADEIAAVQADALERTVDFFSAALVKPAIPARPAPRPKASGNGTRWLLAILAIAASAALVARQRKLAAKF